jgi:signal transduction histidine kinase
MEIRLISRAEDLHRLCRDVVAELPLRNCTLSVLPADSGASADLYIWDFEPTLSLAPESERSASKHLFLVDRKDLSAFFRKGSESPDINLLLKPVSRTMLSAFVGFAVSSHVDNALRTDRDEMFQYLIQTNLKLQQHNDDRTNFLSRAIHDFRAPLTALNGYCGLLRNGSLGPVTELQREVLQRMHDSGKRLSRIMYALLELSFGQQPRSSPQMQPHDIVQCVQQALDSIGPFAGEKRITITTDLWPCEERLHFETDEMEHALSNLLDIACKFAPKDGSVDVRGYPYYWERAAEPVNGGPTPLHNRQFPRPNSYRVDIRDSGAPVPHDHLYHIFEEDAPYTGARDRSGGGLGLAICRMILHRHQGRVWVQNTDLGPMFSLVLPMPAETQNGRGPEHIDQFQAADAL